MKDEAHGRIFTDAESAEGVMVGLTRNLNATWEDHPFQEIQKNS